MYRPRVCSVEFSPALFLTTSHWLSLILTLHTSPSSTPPKLSSTLQSYRSQTRNMSDSTLKASSSPDEPVERTSSPYPDPRQLGPKSKILATRTSNYHSTSLRMVTATNATVNRTCKFVSMHLTGVKVHTSSRRPPTFVPIADITMCIALHPGGVVAQIEHTELENELHEKAHIDYDRVAIVRCPPSHLSFASADRLPSCRFPILPSLPSTKMPSSTKLVLPSHPPALLQHTQGQRLVVHH
jgi:hypothetical protein